MDWLIDPEFFGCGNKVDYFDTLSLAQLGGDQTKGDYSEVFGLRSAAFSIDKVYQCAQDNSTFAAIALNHALNDVLVSSAAPIQAGIAFEFAANLTSDARQELVTAFRRELDRRNIQLGKCHSSLSEVTSVTIAVIATNPRIDRQRASQGDVTLSRAIGHFKMHYLMETGQIGPVVTSTELLTNPFSSAFADSEFSDVTDVSGHGLAGSLHSLATRNSIDIDVILSPHLAAHPYVFEMPNACLLNDFHAFEIEGIDIDIESWRIAGLMETAGPMVGIVNRENKVDQEESCWPKVIGHFSSGKGKLTIKWEE